VSARPAKALRRGTRIGKYRIGRRIGSGSFAQVYQARDTIERRDVALKVALPTVVEQFGRNVIEREARIVAALDHPNIVRVRNADWNDGHFVMATDLAKRSLGAYSGARRSTAVALRVIGNVAAGLAYAHRQGVLHRDLKPENILIFSDRHAAIGDFGVAKFAQRKSRFTEAGTLGYMAPEQAYGRPKFASDVFSLGLIAYELLAGKMPTWPFAWPPEGHARRFRRIPEALQPVLRKAIQVKLASRYADGGSFLRAWDRAIVKIEAEKAPAKRRRRRPVAPEASPFELEAKLFRRRFGSALQLHYDCFRCGGPISEAMGHCPWCGTRDNSLREVTRLPLVCPACEHGARPEWDACPWCFVGRFVGNGRKPPRDPAAERECSRRGCEGQLQPFMRYCPLCKERPRRPWSHASLRDRCRGCRGPVTRQFWRFCPWCGRREPKAAQVPIRRP
jgi:serine/threonine-protein kinase